jgi:hypothetical protein
MLSHELSSICESIHWYTVYQASEYYSPDTTQRAGCSPCLALFEG